MGHAWKGGGWRVASCTLAPFLRPRCLSLFRSLEKDREARFIIGRSLLLLADKSNSTILVPSPEPPLLPLPPTLRSAKDFRRVLSKSSTISPTALPTKENFDL